MPCNRDTGCAGLHEAAGDAGAVADGIETFNAGHEVGIDENLAGVELDFHTVEQGVAAVQTRRNMVKGAQRFDNAGQMTLRQDEGEVAGHSCGQCGNGGGLGQAFLGRPTALEQVAQATKDMYSKS